jgi:hypothetical protein
MKFDMRRIDAFIRRAVDALESIANSLKQQTPQAVQFEQHVYSPSDLTPVDIYRKTKELLSNIKGETIPAFFMAGKDEIDLDNEAAQGFARIESDGIYVKMSPEYYPDLIRQIIAEGEPAAVSIRLHHRKPLT